MKHINLEGQRYGRLIVKSQLPRINEHYRYLCLCDCGKNNRSKWGKFKKW